MAFEPVMYDGFPPIQITIKDTSYMIVMILEADGYRGSAINIADVEDIISGSYTNRRVDDALMSLVNHLFLAKFKGNAGEEVRKSLEFAKAHGVKLPSL